MIVFTIHNKKINYQEKKKNDIFVQKLPKTNATKQMHESNPLTMS